MGPCLLPIEIQLTYSVVLASGVQHSDWVIYIKNIYVFFSVTFHYRLLLATEFSSLCSIVNPCLFILFIVVCIC